MVDVIKARLSCLKDRIQGVCGHHRVPSTTVPVVAAELWHATISGGTISALLIDDQSEYRGIDMCLDGGCQPLEKYINHFISCPSSLLPPPSSLYHALSSPCLCFPLRPSLAVSLTVEQPVEQPVEHPIFIASYSRSRSQTSFRIQNQQPKSARRHRLVESPRRPALRLGRRRPTRSRRSPRRAPVHSSFLRHRKLPPGTRRFLTHLSS
jgi:hypothetical protein